MTKLEKLREAHERVEKAWTALRNAQLEYQDAAADLRYEYDWIGGALAKLSPGVSEVA